MQWKLQRKTIPVTIKGCVIKPVITEGYIINPITIEGYLSNLIQSNATLWNLFTNESCGITRRPRYQSCPSRRPREEERTQHAYLSVTQCNTCSDRSVHGTMTWSRLTEPKFFRTNVSFCPLRVVWNHVHPLQPGTTWPQSLVLPRETFSAERLFKVMAYRAKCLLPAVGEPVSE